MATVKSSAENLTLNADGANNDIIFQSNGSNIATLDQAGLLTATTFAGSGAALTGLFDPDGAVTINDAGADVDFRVESDARTHMLTVDGANNVVGISHGGFMGDLGQGLHIKTTDTGGDAHTSADELVIEHNSNGGITILSANSGVSDGCIYFGDAQDNDIGKILYNHNDDHMEFFTNTAKQLQLESNGDVSVKTGDIVFTTAGKGICLGVTSNTAANTLDDYEEGTWTPANSGATFTGTPTGTYTKIGDLVTVRFNFTINGIGSGATNRITGLPFAVRGGAEGYGVSGNYSGLARNSCYCWCYTTGSNVYFIDSTAIDANSGVNAAVLGNGTNIPGQVTYWTNS